MKLRRATAADVLDVLAWRNDPHARAMFKTSALVGIEEHRVWFAKILAEPGHLLLIGESGAAKVGMVRFDQSGGQWAVSINVAPALRGQGFGRALLCRGVEFIAREHGDCELVAEINIGNAASIAVFEKCGFVRSAEGGDYLLLRRSAG